MKKGTITVRTDPETLERLDRLADALDRSRNYLMNQALKAFLEDQAWQIEEIQAGLTELDRGEGVPHERAMAEMEGHLEDKAS